MSLQTNTDDSQARLDKVIAGMTEEWRKERSETQMTLGGLIDRLSELDPEMTMKGLCSPDSYRGYYSDLAFDVSGDRKVRMSWTMHGNLSARPLRAIRAASFVWIPQPPFGLRSTDVQESRLCRSPTTEKSKQPKTISRRSHHIEQIKLFGGNYDNTGTDRR